MPEEQIIYLDPGDDVTKVRERLEQVPAKRIIMIVQQQTQLRSHVGWRLLHARAREMGKDILVISTDRQVRAVAKAAGFKVAESQESPVSKSRPPSRPTRSGSSIKGSGPRARKDPGENRPLRQREQPSGRVPTREDNVESRISRAEEPFTSQGAGRFSSDFAIEEESEFEPPFEYSIDSPRLPPARPLVPRLEEDESDPLVEDYDTTRRIWEAARESNPGLSEPESPASQGMLTPEPSDASTRPDAFEQMTDMGIPPSPLPEQRGAAPIHDVEEGVPDISDVSTHEMHVEDLGDQGDFSHIEDIPTQQWSNASFASSPPSDEPEAPPRLYGSRARGSRSGALPRRPLLTDFDEEDALPPPIEDRSAQNAPPRQAGTSGARTRTGQIGNRGAQGASVTPRLGVSRPLAPAPGGAPAARPQIPARGAAPPPVKAPARQPDKTPGKRRNRAFLTVMIALLLLFLLGVGLFYALPGAAVTITVPASPLSISNVALYASTNSADKAHNTIPSQVLRYTASATGVGTATGTTKQGNSKASGNVTFTNNGTQQVTIPTGTILSTPAGSGTLGVTFSTTANAVVSPADANTPPTIVPVEAVNPGAAGNVGANTVTVIPDTSITQIASASGISTSAVNLKVTNAQAFTGGGAANVAAVTKGDLQALTATLHKQLQNQVNTWLRAQMHQGDVQGALTPDVLGSATPLPQEQLTGTPAVDTPLASNSFTGKLSVSVSILVARSQAIMSAAKSALNAQALKQRQVSTLVDNGTFKLIKVNHKVSNNGTLLTITVDASGQVIQRIDTRIITGLIVGKTVEQARSEITGPDSGIRGVEAVKIEISPSFLTLLPLRSDNIHITIQPGPAPTKAIPNSP